MSDPKPHPPEAKQTTLVFNEGNHTYRLDGKPIRGVTGLIKAGLPKDALIPWAAEQAAKLFLTDPEGFAALATADPEEFTKRMKWAHREARDKAAKTGTAVHKAAEEMHRTGEVEAEAEIAGYVEGYAAFLDEWQIEPVLMERPCANRKDWYAGTFDLLCRSPFLAGGELVQIDMKTSKGVYGETALQTAAYAKAEFYVDHLGYERPMPKVHATYVANVTPMDRDGDHERYEKRPLGTRLYRMAGSPDEIDSHFEWFLAASYTAKVAKLREKLGIEPLELPTKENADA